MRMHIPGKYGLVHMCIPGKYSLFYETTDIGRLLSDMKSFQLLLLSDLDKPTVDCSRDISKYGVFVTTPLGIIGGLLAVIAVAFSVYKIYKEHQKTKRRANVSAAEKERLENDIKEFLEALENPSLDETKKRVYIEKLKKTLNINRGLLVGDGPEDDEEEDCLIEQ